MQNDTTLYEEKTERIDHSTGEVIEEVNRKVVKKEKTPEFVMLFVGGVDRLSNANLSKSEHQTLAQLLKYTVKSSNLLMIQKETKEMIARDASLEYSTVDQNIRKLVKKNMLIRKNKLFCLNPDIFGKGDFNEVKKLRHTLQIDYDFENLEAVTTTKTAIENYSDEDVEVIGIEEKVKDNKREQVIITQAVEEEQQPQSLDELFNMRSFTSFDEKMNNATQNSEIRDLAYADIGTEEYDEAGHKI